MSRDDSGLIDLFAIHEQARVEASLPPPPSAPFSAPPAAFTTDLTGSPGLGDLDDELALQGLGRSRRKKQIGILAGVVVALLGVIALAASSGEPADAEAAARATEAARAAAASPPPAETALPERISAPEPAVSAAAPGLETPAPPSTGAPAVRASSRGRAPRAPAARPRATGGPKLMKVQSSGIQDPSR